MIKIIQNPNFQNWFTIRNQKTNEETEVANRPKALRVAMKLAKEVGDKQVVMQDTLGMEVIPV
jgi:hypothetical protein